VRSIAAIEEWIESFTIEGADAASPGEMLRAGEEVLENWLVANDKTPTFSVKEGFRLLALHRQAAQGEPSFNACRETCREVCYRFNMAGSGLAPAEWRSNLATLRRVVQHLVYFIGGKLRNAQLGEFCCASRTVRNDPAEAEFQREELT
jgi:hypothetical protein